MTRALRLLACVSLTFTGATYAATSWGGLIRDTPCLQAYRDWIFSNTSLEPFRAPEPYTPEQCERAAQVHEYIQATEELERDEEATRRSQATADESARALRELDARLAAYARQREAYARQMAAKQAALARLPAPALGMSASQAASTRWGEPLRRSRTTTASGVRELWLFSGRRAMELVNGTVTALVEN